MEAVQFKSRFWRNIFLVLILVFTACKNNQQKDENLEENESVDNSQATLEEPKAQVYRITTNSMEFNLPKDTLQSGWHNIEYRNNSNETHFVIFEKYPEGKGLADTEKEVGPAFQEGMDFIMEGEMDKAMAAFGKLPEWYSKVEFYGGTGLISPKSVAESTIKLDPGVYVLECYVKMPDGRFHSAAGMVNEIFVTDKENEQDPPKSDYTIEIGSENGIVMEDNPSAGIKTFRVDFKDQKLHENFVGHDLHLVRMENGATQDSLTSWLNWSIPKGLMTPAPQGFKFIGGMQEMAEGKTGYFKADLKPGNYVLVSEVPKQKEKGLLKEFKVE